MSEPTPIDSLATLRHELRTPINHILGYGEMIAEELADLGRADLVEDLDKVHAAAKRLLGLIDANLQDGGLADDRAAGASSETSTVAGSAQPDNALSTTLPVEACGHLLVVDDNAENRHIMRRLLERQGHTVDEAPDGEVALEKVGEQAFDLVLLDVLMPKIDGNAALARMKADPKLRHIPVIMISALDGIAAVIKCIEAGAEDYLPKPFNPTLLRARIGACLEKKRLRDQEQKYLRTIEETQARLSEELTEAANYVRSIIPPPLEEPWKIDWRYFPSGELGGDAFGYHWIDDEHFAIYLLDVCGHGVGPALLSVTAINVIRSGSLAGTDLRCPGDVLAALNNAFLMENQNNLYFTIWYGVVHAPTRRLRYASGGHPPSLLLRNGEAIPLRTNGMMIGAVEDMSFPDAEFQLEGDDRLIVLCDGTYEVHRADGTMIDFEDFSGFMAEHGTDPGGLDALMEWVDTLQSGAPLKDDFSILRIQF
ncbi:MAG: SpoIIE family protein phosphatase [Chthoniobacterales bacterium]